NFQFCRIEAAFDPALTVLFGINENGVELAVEPLHITPRHAFEETVLRQDADVLRKIGMINAAGLQVEHLGRKQCRKPNRARCADNNLGETFPLNIIQHLKNWWETQFL